MAPIFSREQILRSSTPPIGIIAGFSTEFAVLGHPDVPLRLLNILNKEYPLHGLETELPTLNFAWAATGSWPEGFPEEAKSAEAQQEQAEAAADDLWPDAIEEDEQTEDEKGLEVVLKLVEELSAARESLDEGGADEDSDDEDGPEALDAAISEALSKALDLSIKLGSDGKTALDDQSAGLLKKIADRLHAEDQIDALSHSARAWPFLIKGELAKAVGVDSSKVSALGADLIAAVTEWFKNGPQTANTGAKSIKELLDTCDKKTREHWPNMDEVAEHHPKPESLFIGKPAPKADVEKLEKELEVKLPEDVREYLSLSNGFGPIIADEVFGTSLHAIEEIEWVNPRANAENDSDDEDEDAPELVEGPPSKKLKMMDGNQLLAIAKKAEKKANGEAPSNSDDDGEDDDDDGMAGFGDLAGDGFAPSLKIELLSLPELVLEEYEEAHGDVEWPEVSKAIEIGGDHTVSLWLLPPEQVKKAKDAYLAMYDAVDEQQKKAIRWAMIAWAGSEDAFRKFDDWAVVGWSKMGMADMSTWSNFRKYLEEMAENLNNIEVVDDAEEAKKLNGCFAYRCR